MEMAGTNNHHDVDDDNCTPGTEAAGTEYQLLQQKQIPTGHGQEDTAQPRRQQGT